MAVDKERGLVFDKKLDLVQFGEKATSTRRRSTLKAASPLRVIRMTEPLAASEVHRVVVHFIEHRIGLIPRAVLVNGVDAAAS